MKTKINHISKYSRKFLIMFVLLLCSVYTFSTKVTFKGTSLTNPTDWSDATNWTSGVVPTVSVDTVVIDSNRTAIIGNGVQAFIQRLTLNFGAKLTNHGTFTISPTTVSGSALFLSGNNTFDNEAALSITSENQTTVSAIITIGGIGNNLVFNGTTNLAAKAGNNAIVANNNSNCTISGAGFTMGDEANGTAFSPFSATSDNATIVIDKQTTINLNIGASRNGFYLSIRSNIVNNGTLTIHAGLSTSGASLHAINMWETSTSATSTNCSFTNNGTLNIAGFIQPVVMGGTKWFAKLENTGVLNITTTSVSGAMCIFSGNLPNVILNSGTMNLNAYSNAIKLNSTTTAVDNFINTGTINITKGNISSAANSGAILTYPTLNNNEGGIINFNYGVPVGSTSALGTVMLSNNKGGTIHGSCTFPASTLVTNDGSTLSPGDYDLVNNQSGIGTMIITPAVAGTKYVLQGRLEVQINGSNSTSGAAGTLYDQLKCSEIDVTAANVSATVGYTPSVMGEFAGVVYASTSKAGPFAWGIYSPGWDVDNTSATTVGVKYTGKTAVEEVKIPCRIINSNGNLIISMDNNISAKIDLIDLKANVIVSKEAVGSLILPVKAYKGVYFLRISSADKVQIVKLMLNS